MIYFLVNNNFHLLDAEENIKHLRNQPVGLIKIPHKLTISPKFNYELELEFPPLIHSLIDHFRFLRIAQIHKSVKKQLNTINSTDVLIIYTEYEYLTHYVVKLFKKKNAKVILIEEGFPTYLAFASIPDSVVNFKKKILNYYLKNILGYKNTKVVSINDKYSTQLTDNQIDLVLLYTDLNIVRKINKQILESKQFKQTEINENSILFLNEAMYDHYINMDEYLTILEDIILNLSSHFEVINFKFHPRENETTRNKISAILSKFSKVVIINNDSPVELLIEEIGSKYVGSFLAQTLLYLSNSNYIPLYLFQLYPEIMRNKVFITVKKVIDEMNYTFINNWSEIKNKEIGFSQNKNNNVQNLQYHLDNLTEHLTN